MAEYIERDAAVMTAMDYGGSGNAQDASQDIASLLSEIPAADVVSVVRCRECKYGTLEKNAKGEDMVECWNKDCPCSFHAYLIPPNWFCAEGERREELQ